MKDWTRFAVHQTWRSDNLAAEDLPDCLMAQANPENRNRLVEALNHLLGDSCIVWRARSGRNDNMRRVQAFDFFERHAIVAEHAQLMSHLTEILHEVVGKRIVVVDDEDHSSNPLCAS